MIPADRDGRVTLDLAGRPVTLRFTWGAIDALGEAGVTERLERVRAGAPGGLAALAELIAAASDGAIEAQAVMAASPPAAQAVDAVARAWLVAIHGPARQAAEERHGGDPRPDRRQGRSTWWRRRFASRSPVASTRRASSPPRPT